MKKYLIKINNKEIEIEQDNDGKFIIPEFIKEQEKFGSCLKPAYEPIIVARKPFKGSLVENVEKYRVGGLNIDECRVKAVDQKEFEKNWTERKADGGFGGGEIHLFNGGRLDGENAINYTPNGRFPANIILDDSEEVRAGFPNTKSSGGKRTCPKFGDGKLGICNYKTIGGGESGNDLHCP